MYISPHMSSNAEKKPTYLGHHLTYCRIMSSVFYITHSSAVLGCMQVQITVLDQLSHWSYFCNVLFYWCFTINTKLYTEHRFKMRGVMLLM